MWKKSRAKFGPKGAKSGPKLGFSLFSQVWFISFPDIALDDSLEHCLTTSRGKTHEKTFGVPKLDPKPGLLPFSLGYIISFPWYCTRLQLGTMCNI